MILPAALPDVVGDQDVATLPLLSQLLGRDVSLTNGKQMAREAKIGLISAGGITFVLLCLLLCLLGH
jgi:tetrahydromethanopterin S-methyltransferase subunit F